MGSASTLQLTPEFLAQDRRPQARIGIGVVTALSGVVVLIRVYAPWSLIRSFGWDDGLICIAMLMNIVVMALSLQVLRYGAGLHIWALDLAKTPLLYKWLVAAQLVYMIALWVCRLSGLAFYHRLNPMPQFQLYLRVSFAFVTAVMFAQVLIIALQCVPLAALWGGAEGKCMGSKTVFISTAAMTIICDSLILFLPIKIVFSIKANATRKAALSVVLTSVCRIVSMIPAINETDATWYFSVVMVWSDTEVSTAIIALSLPALKGLVGAVAGSTRKATSQEQSGSNGHELNLENVHPEYRPHMYQGLTVIRMMRGSASGKMRARTRSGWITAPEGSMSRIASGLVSATDELPPWAKEPCQTIQSGDDPQSWSLLH
ncbi:uncharacterized protein BO80DRAFT_448986 [Aspergillus ibericus CBS 121593]|uniref:Rhodopsin domain-containing protein n=1 Tax=Aspergillus ibericus CBS 121593 TaxID=1448316 RepID=A0A395GN65_9EURO|nr:hypothetical protein BO80DRAFT_448986 [Aspergillus ibericus CBS 121593]RAK96824.1 hypothetical protein BO80DRAFT_448986 [Aspergillus ibericus CBS 121593]